MGKCLVCEQASETDVCEACERHHDLWRPSRIGLYAGCQAAWWECRDLDAPPDSPAAAKGRELHVAVREADLDKLPFEDAHLIAKAREWVAERVGLDRVPASGIPAALDAHGAEWERILVLRDPVGKVLTWGRADFVYRKPPVVVDFKFGHREPPRQLLAWQVRIYGAALYQLLGVPVKVLVGCPRTGQEYEALIDGTSMIEIVSAVAQLQVARVTATERTYTPGPQTCLDGYCPALTVCPAARSLVTDTALEITEKPSLAAMPMPKLESFMDRAEIVAELYDQARTEMRRRLAAGEESKRYTIQTVRGARQVDDPQTAFQRVADVLPVADFMRAVDLRITTLEERYVEALKKKEENASVGVKALKQRFEAALGDAVSRGADKAQLRRRR